MKTAANVITTRLITSMVAGIALSGVVGIIASIFIRPMTVQAAIVIMVLCTVAVFVARLPTYQAEVKTTEQREQAMAVAVPAQALICEARQTGTSSGSVYVDLTMDVELPDGKLYRGTVKQFKVKLIDVPRIQPGEVIPVKIDPSRPQFIFANAEWLTAIET